MDAGRFEILDHLPQPAFAVAPGPSGPELVYANDRYRALTGGAGAVLAGARGQIERALVEQVAVTFEIDVDDGRRTLQIECAPVAGDQATVLLGVARDVTSNLPNRLTTVESLGAALTRTQGPAQLGLVFVDVDDFDVVNDRLGHEAGDALLTIVARRVEGALRAGDSIARHGSDRFAIVCENVDGVAGVLAVAERVGRIFDDPFALDAGEVYLAANIGVVMANGAQDRPERMLRDADAAVSHARQRGQGAIEVYDDRMRARAVERREIEQGLRTALEHGELRVHYQPLVRFAESQVIGFEALVRWQHPQRGLLAPDAFLDVAEESGLIVPIGAWVLREACMQSARWATESMYDAPLVVAVNVASRQLVPEFVDTVERALADSGLVPQSLVLEITERVLVHDANRIGGVLRRLHDLGVQLAVDDFGTGQTALGYLKELPIHSLKIDRSFVDGLGENDKDAAIVAAVVSLGHALGLSVTAEGVETPRQLSELRSLGCDLGQGYYFAHPQPGEIVRALVHRRFQWKQPA